MNSIEEDPQSFFAPQILLKRWQDENMENEMILNSNPFLQPKFIYLKRRAAESNVEPESNIELNPEPNDIRIKLDSLPSNDVAEHPGLQSDQVPIDKLKERSRIQRREAEPNNEPSIEQNPDSNAEPNDIRIKLDSLPSNDVAEHPRLQSDQVPTFKERSHIQRRAAEPNNEPEPNIELNPDSNAEPNDIRIKLDSLPSNDVAEPTGLQSEPVSVDELKERSERDAK
jgi:hypothetical protein